MPAVRDRVSIESPGPEGYLGLNTALQFSQLTPSQSPSLKNAWMPKIGSLGKRPGTIPVTASALAAAMEYLTKYKASASSGADEEIYAASGTTLYKFNGIDTFTALTMTDALVSADIYTVGFTNALLTSILAIGDGGDLKQCNGSTVVDILPAADDPAPAPANVLANVNLKGCKFIWEYSGHIFISPGTNELFYTKRFEFNYVPSTQYFFLVNDNDYVNGDGQAFDAVCLIPMRRSWAILTGENFDTFKADKFLNTKNGVIAPRSIAKITYPNGTQTIAYLSDDGVHEVYTALIDGGGRQYATRSLMKDKIDFNALGLTEAEKAAAKGYYFSDWNLYLLCFTQGTTKLAYVYDTRNGQWYPWTNMIVASLIDKDGVLYYASSTHMRKFDEDLYSDWEDIPKTIGTPVHFQRYSPLLSVEFSGFSSTWDYYLVEAKQWLVPSTLDISVNFTNTTSAVSVEAAWKNNVFVWGVSKWGDAQWANLNFTDIVNAPDELIFHDPSKYAQVLWDNPRDEPVLIFKDRWKVRLSIKR